MSSGGAFCVVLGTSTRGQTGTLVERTIQALAGGAYVMVTPVLETVARALVAPGKGILAADESTRTIARRFESVRLACTEKSC
jgi:hypothetical protein